MDENPSGGDVVGVGAMVLVGVMVGWSVGAAVGGGIGVAVSVATAGEQAERIVRIRMSEMNGRRNEASLWSCWVDLGDTDPPG